MSRLDIILKPIQTTTADFKKQQIKALINEHIRRYES